MKDLYQRRPVQVQAVQWTGNNVNEILQMLDIRDNPRLNLWQEPVAKEPHWILQVATDRGTVNLAVSDWLIIAPHGDIAIHDAEEFALLYELAEVEAAPKAIDIMASA